MAVGNGNRKEQFEQLDGVIAQWKGVEGGLLPIMQHAQEILGCVDEEVQHYISAATGIPVSTIYGVATFYSQFTLKPRGKYTMGICLGTACYVRGSQQVLDEIEKKAQQTGKKPASVSDPEPTDEELEGDEMLPAAVDVILETGQASVSMLQRRLKLGYARAARIVDEMEEKGIVGPFQGSKPRAILITKEQWQAKKGGQTEQMGFDDLDSVPDELM